ncbi:UDP-N-acetylmuramoyl-L-alanyl-D-glutamate--2,6-diaminopimelate ligase [Sulfidibacter corallicola]|uniref:UDP-N-acetylmuramoyl-L-alanyl-D-glutamate--2,6-diaminopimelate ligase n=1 Tax=Sulfidibacter corallicola TaxID=2818388 RepID=A0A8A4TES8_SULCO|nr:UDP-N-acetylmuramoyl-L-alanyl-D-glutamate--2,6-diaminopimelate ligase [Sulfidibacter corallicola]QTD48047.1 UDP-N-acetylmuramoyl-L-alanyl-D-glutamate--2,6-diaminopimelate ligase [Sulfidibacter corallicola]
MKLRELVDGIGELLAESSGDLKISQITHDSRKVQHGSMFVAIEGRHRDGHNYVGCATQLGAVCILTNQPEKVPFSIPICRVDDPRKAMALMARRLYDHPDQKIKIIGVTGTNGKTTTTYLTSSLLRRLGTCGRIGTLSYFNGHSEERATRTTPESSEFYRCLGEMVSNRCAYAAVEISSHGLMFDRVLGLELQYGIFTNLSRDHLDFHGNMESYFQAKHRQFSLLRRGGTAILNWDDPYAKRIVVPEGRHTIRFGQSEEADLRFEIGELGIKGASFRVNFKGDTHDFRIPLMGEHNVYNFTAALAVALCEGRKLSEIAQETGDIRAVPGRLELIDVGQTFGVAIDFAHTPDALQSVLRACAETNPKRMITVFGAGGDRDHSKRPEMGAIAGRYSDIVILTTDNPRTEDPEVIMDMVHKGIKRPLGPGFIRQTDRRQAIHAAIHMAEEGDLILIAGKGHETTQEIHGRHYPFSDWEVALGFIQQRIRAKPLREDRVDRDRTRPPATSPRNPASESATPGKGASDD